MSPEQHAKRAARIGRSIYADAFAAGRLAGIREAAEIVEAHAKDMMVYRDHHYVAKHLRSARDDILALASGKERP